MSKHTHPYHLVSVSPLPLLSSLSLLLSILLVWSTMSRFVFLFCLLFLSSIFSLWFRDILRESFFLGYHTSKVRSSLCLGFLFFLCSEVFLFFSFFWAYLHGALSPDVWLGGNWPPAGVSVPSPFTIPLLNTCLLLVSASWLTWAHGSLIRSCYFSCFLGVSLTLCLGLIFLLCQLFEYSTLSFTIADSFFGSVFFLGTGFHGLHVVAGILFLLVSLFRLVAGQLRSTRHLGFLFAIWYWHFVDVIWLILFLVFYVWGF